MVIQQSDFRIFSNSGLDSPSYSAQQPIYEEVKPRRERPSTGKKHTKKVQPNSATNEYASDRKDKALIQIQDIKDQLNQELLTLLDYEQEQENDRDAKIKEIADSEERQRLDKIFGVERARASNRIMQVSK